LSERSGWPALPGQNFLERGNVKLVLPRTLLEKNQISGDKYPIRTPSLSMKRNLGRKSAITRREPSTPEKSSTFSSRAHPRPNFQGNPTVCRDYQAMGVQ
jgi:hypothetical protein